MHIWQDEEADDLAKTMMSKKTKRLYGRMQHGINKKQAAVKTLMDKRNEQVLSSTASTTIASIATASTASKGKKGGKK